MIKVRMDVAKKLLSFFCPFCQSEDVIYKANEEHKCYFCKWERDFDISGLVEYKEKRIAYHKKGIKPC